MDSVKHLYNNIRLDAEAKAKELLEEILESQRRLEELEAAHPGILGILEESALEAQRQTEEIRESTLKLIEERKALEKANNENAIMNEKE